MINVYEKNNEEDAYNRKAPAVPNWYKDFGWKTLLWFLKGRYSQPSLYHAGLVSGLVPSWMTKGRTALSERWNETKCSRWFYADNLPLAIVDITDTNDVRWDWWFFIDEGNLLFDKQKECRKRLGGTNHFLFIDKMVWRPALPLVDSRVLGYIWYAVNIKKLLVERMKSWKKKPK